MSTLPSASLRSSASVDFLGRLEARQHLDADRPVGEAVAEVAGSAAGPAAWSAPAPRPGSRRWRRRTPRAARLRSCRSRRRRRRRGPWRWRGQVGEHRLDRAALVRRFLERELRGELGRSWSRRSAVHGPGGPRAGHRCPAVRRRRRAPFRRPCAWPAPRHRRRANAAAQFRRGAGVAGDQLQLRHRHVELVALGVLDARNSPSVAARPALPGPDSGRRRGPRARSASRPRVRSGRA